MKFVKDCLNDSMPYSSMFRIKNPLYVVATLDMITFLRNDEN